jgi:hypothetical protein
MPRVERPLVAGGVPRLARRHLWRGGHDPGMVRQALDIRFAEAPAPAADTRLFRLTLANVGAAHYVPTGTPDRHLLLTVRLLDVEGNTLGQEERLIKRRVMWRPFIVDLWDNRLPFGEPKEHDFEFSRKDVAGAQAIEAVVRYGLVDQARLERIGYTGGGALAYDVFRQRLELRGDGRAP